MKRPEDYRTYRRSRSVRLPEYSYDQPDAQYAVTLCCAERSPLLDNASTSSVIFDTFLEVLPRKGYEVLAMCFMPEHVHVVLKSVEGCAALGTAIGAAKSLARKRVGGEGITWQGKYCDHVVRSTEDIRNQIPYAINNPVVAELIEDAMEWPWTYVHPEFRP